MVRAASVALLCLAALGAKGFAAAGQVAIEVNGCHILAEVADTPDARERGLMFRIALPADHGMLFVYPNAARHCMWMRNTYLPLSVAFLDERGQVINIDDMTPQTDTGHCAVRPARYVLEMAVGWFRQHGVGVGSGLDFQVAPAQW